MKELALPISLAALVAISGATFIGRIGFALGGDTPIQGSGKMKTESRKLGSFSTIDSRGSIDIDVSVGQAQTVAVTADDNLLSIVETKIENGNLVIRPTKSYNSKKGILVRITVPALKTVSLSGSGDATVRGISGSAFALSVKGSGDAKLSGSTQKFEGSIAGSGDIDAISLNADTVEVSVKGSGDAAVCAIRSLQASVMGSGDVTYKGSPKVQKSVLGSGSVEPAK